MEFEIRIAYQGINPSERKGKAQLQDGLGQRLGQPRGKLCTVRQNVLNQVAMPTFIALPCSVSRCRLPWKGHDFELSVSGADPKGADSWGPSADHSLCGWIASPSMKVDAGWDIAMATSGITFQLPSVVAGLVTHYPTAFLPSSPFRTSLIPSPPK